jgi:hypothetical protein
MSYIIKQTNVFDCCLCGKGELGYGNNAYPLSAEGDRCCDKCNIQVVQARMRGQFRCEFADPEELIYDCERYLRTKLTDYADEVMVEFCQQRFQDFIIPNEEPYTFYYERRNTLIRNLTLEIHSVIQRSKAYLKGRISRHLTIRSVSSIHDLCWTTLPDAKGSVRDFVCASITCEWDDLRSGYNAVKAEEDRKLAKKQEEEQKQKEEALKAIWKQEQEEIQLAKRTQKADTRDANKIRDAKKKEKEEFEKRQIECARLRAQLEAKKKQQKAQKKAQAQKLK